MDTSEIATKTSYELLQQMVEGTGDPTTMYADRIAALAELNNRRDIISPLADQNSEEFAIYRVRGAVACYDFRECSNLELRVVVRWCVNRFQLNLVLWWDQEEYHPGYEEGGES